MTPSLTENQEGSIEVSSKVSASDADVGESAETGMSMVARRVKIVQLCIRKTRFVCRVVKLSRAESFVLKGMIF